MVHKHAGWVDWYSFFGTTPPVRQQTRLSYEQCREAVRELGSKSKSDFEAWCKANQEERLARGIPRNLDVVYKDATPPVTQQTRLSYERCREAVRELGSKSQSDFRAWCKKIPFLPVS